MPEVSPLSAPTPTQANSVMSLKETHGPQQQEGGMNSTQTDAQQDIADLSNMQSQDAAETSTSAPAQHAKSDAPPQRSGIVQPNSNVNNTTRTVEDVGAGAASQSATEAGDTPSDTGDSMRTGQQAEHLSPAKGSAAPSDTAQQPQAATAENLLDKAAARDLGQDKSRSNVQAAEPHREPAAQMPAAAGQAVFDKAADTDAPNWSGDATYGDAASAGLAADEPEPGQVGLSDAEDAGTADTHSSPSSPTHYTAPDDVPDEHADPSNRFLQSRSASGDTDMQQPEAGLADQPSSSHSAPESGAVRDTSDGKIGIHRSSDEQQTTNSSTAIAGPDAPQTQPRPDDGFTPTDKIAATSHPQDNVAGQLDSSTGDKGPQDSTKSSSDLIAASATGREAEMSKRASSKSSAAADAPTGQLRGTELPDQASAPDQMDASMHQDQSSGTKRGSSTPDTSDNQELQVQSSGQHASRAEPEPKRQKPSGAAFSNDDALYSSAGQSALLADEQQAEAADIDKATGKTAVILQRWTILATRRHSCHVTECLLWFAECYIAC